MSSILFRTVARASSSRHGLGAIRTAVVTTGTPSVSNKYLRDEEIKVPGGMVHLVDADTGRLLPIQPLSSILARISRKLEFVQLVEPEKGIVKIINRQALVDEARQRRKKIVARHTIEQKEIQMTWGLDGGDFEHKIAKTREELLKGNRVDIVFVKKKKQTVPTPEGMVERTEQCVAALADAGKEWKERRFQAGSATVYLQGAVPETRNEPTLEKKVSKSKQNQPLPSGTSKSYSERVKEKERQGLC